MTRSLAGLAVLALTANSLFAQLSLPTTFPAIKGQANDPILHLPIVKSPGEAITTVSLTGRNSWDSQFAPVNDRATVDLGTLLGTPGGAVRVIGLGWDTVIEAFSPSYACEATIGFSDQLYLQAGVTDCFPTPGGAPYSSGGIVNLVDLNFDFVVGDGLLNLEWFESFDDFPGAIDASYLSGDLTLEFEAFTTPDPPSAMDLGVIANAGDRVVLDTVGSDFDTELGLYDSQGNLMAENDDFGGTLQSLIVNHNTPAGEYYIGLGGFNTEYRPLWDARPGDASGNYVFNYTATDSMSGFLNSQEIKWFKFEVVPEPSSMLLLVLGGLSLLSFRHRDR